MAIRQLLRLSALAIVLFGTSSLQAQINNGGFGNTGLQNNSIFGGGGDGEGLGGGTFGQFDASFGASTFGESLAIGAATAQAFGRTNTALGLSGLGGVGGFNLGGFGGGGFGNRGGFNNQNSNQDQPTVRAVVRIGFPYSGTPASAKTIQVNERLSRMPIPVSLETMRVEMEGRVAVLKGTLPSEEDAKLVQRLLSLEPGIDDIRSELVFVAPSLQAIPSDGGESVPVPPPVDEN